MKPWFSLGTLVGLCALLWAKFHHVDWTVPDIAWWVWPFLLLGGIALNVGFFAWLARMGLENAEAVHGKALQTAAATVFVLLIML
jgi:hypothetical protein